MRHVNFLTFVFKLIYFFYLTFILLPIACIGAIILMCYVFLQWIIQISIIKKNTVVSNVSIKKAVKIFKSWLLTDK
jgi:hypothetical protein